MKENELKLIFEFFNEVGIINQLSTNILNKHLPLGLKYSQFSVINHFMRNDDGVTHAELATVMQVTKGAMTNTLNRLKVHDLIQIKSDAMDGRIKRVFLTQKGREIHGTSIQSLYSYMVSVLNTADIDLNEFKQALPILTRVREVLDNNR